MEKYVSARVINKHALESDWINSDFVPLVDELIIYDIDENHSYPRLKIGDGVTSINQLPFMMNAPIFVGTSEEYNSAEQAGCIKEGTIVYITDDEIEDEADLSTIVNTVKKYQTKHNNSSVAHNKFVERKHKSAVVELLTSNWVDNNQSVEIDGLSSYDDVIVGSSVESMDAYTAAGVTCVNQADSSYYVEDNAEELAISGSFDNKEDLYDLDRTMTFERNDTSEAKDYVTAHYDSDHPIEFHTGAKISANKTYHFSAKFRLNEAATHDTGTLRIWFQYNNISYFTVWTPYEVDRSTWSQPVGGPAFALCKKGYDTSTHTYLASANVDQDGWRTIEFDYTSTAEQLLDGNLLQVRLYRGPGDENIQPFDMKDFTLTEVGSTENLIVDGDFSSRIDLSKKFTTGMTLDQGRIFVTAKNDVDTPIVYLSHVHPEYGKTYQIDLCARLNTEASKTAYKLSSKLYLAGIRRDMIITKNQDQVDPPKSVMNIEGVNSNYPNNATVYNHAGDDSYNVVVDEDGKECVQFKYTTLNTTINGADTVSNYHLMCMFRSAGAVPSSAKYIRIMYKTNTTQSSPLVAINNATSETQTVISDISVSNGTWVISDPVELIYDSFIPRLNRPLHLTFKPYITDPDFELYVRDIMFFDSMESAEKYTSPENQCFKLTKEDWKTISFQTTFTDATEYFANTDYYSFYIVPVTKGDLEPIDIDSISIKQMTSKGTLTFQCSVVPTQDLTANVVILGG